MRLLLDTHIALWWLKDPGQLRAEARAAIADGHNVVFVSAASVWELSIKIARGRLRLGGPFWPAVEEAGFTELPVRARHAARAGALPSIHGDPFDRMLIAQAQEDGLTIATRDRLIRQYGTPTLDA